MGLKLLCVVAHPDDECFAFGGALALCADRGVETSVVCLTDGQAATNRGASTSAEDLGCMRSEEFAASCNILGVAHFELLDYQDAKLEFASLSSMAEKLVARIRSFRPQVVLTFGGDGGMNTHADHTTVSAATTAAFHWAGSPKRFPGLGEPFTPQRLYYSTTSFFLEGRLAPIPMPWSATLDIRPVFDRKKRAFAAHTSQAPVMYSVMPVWEKLGQEERYALAATTKPQAVRESTDLFEGVEASSGA